MTNSEARERALAARLYAERDALRRPSRLRREDAAHLAQVVTSSNWLAERVAEARAEELRAAAADYTNRVGGSKARPVARKWLLERADRIARGDS